MLQKQLIGLIKSLLISDWLLHGESRDGQKMPTEF